jgi:hypothetical protein
MSIRCLVVAVSLLAFDGAHATDLNRSWDDPLRVGV